VLRPGYSFGMRQLGYYSVIILLGFGNLALAAIAYRQRDKQLKGNALRETQVELAELRNEMAHQRMEYLRTEVELLREIRDAVVGGDLSCATPAGDRPSDLRRKDEKMKPVVLHGVATDGWER
jgi:hypothetical protein